MDILFFPNGNTAVFENDKQIPRLQKGWIEVFAEFLENENIDPTKAKVIMPSRKKAEIFKTPHGYNWRIL